jgi:6-phosphogluconolactonase
VQLRGDIVQRDLRILTNLDAIARRVAQEFVQAATAAVSEKGSFSVALSGGSTPKALYSLLANDAGLRAQLPWDKMYFYFGDERSVGPDHADSNFRMANETMLSKVPIKPEQVFRVKGEYKDTEKAAQEYDEALRSSFKMSNGKIGEGKTAGGKIAEGQFPRFDLVLLGMGNEGHTASLFPGTKALYETKRIAVRNWVGKLYTDRITLTAPAINNAARVIFMVTGADKALALKGVLEGPYEPEQLPAQMIQQSNGQLLWLVDTTAGGMLSIGIRE